MTEALQWDNGLKAMWGLPPDAPVDEAVFRAGIRPNDQARVQAAIDGCVDPSGNGIYQVEYRVIGLSAGVERWVSTYGRTSFDKAGRAVRFIGAALKITERKRAETAARESDERLRAALLAVSTGTYRWVIATDMFEAMRCSTACLVFLRLRPSGIRASF